jgi:hypothetical protein
MVLYSNHRKTETWRKQMIKFIEAATPLTMTLAVIALIVMWVL